MPRYEEEDHDQDFEAFLLEEEDDDDEDDDLTDDRPNTSVSDAALAQIDAMNDPDITHLDAPPVLGGRGGGGRGSSAEDIFDQPRNAAIGRASSPKLYAQAAQFPEVTQLRVWKWDNGVPVALGVIDAEASEEDFIRKFYDSMPKRGEGRCQYRVRPVNIRGQEVGTEATLVIGEHHSELVRRRKMEEEEREMGGGGRFPFGRGMGGDDLSSSALSEMSKMSQHLIAGAEERAERMEEILEEERERLRKQELERSKERVDMASTTLAAVQSMTERMMADERARNDQASQNQAQNAQFLIQMMNQSASTQMQMMMQQMERQRVEDERRMQQERERREEERRIEQDRRREEQREWELRRDRERAENEARLRREQQEWERKNEERRMEMEQRIQMMRLEAEQRAQQAREDAERKAREHERWLEAQRQELERRRDQERQELELKLQREREEREARDRREREEREAKERWMAAQQQAAEDRRREHETRLMEAQMRREEREREERRLMEQERQRQHERAQREMELDRQRDREHRLHMQELARKELEAASKQGGFDSIMAAAGMLRQFGVEPNELLPKLFGGEGEGKGKGLQPWLENLPSILGAVSKLVPGQAPPGMQPGMAGGPPMLPAQLPPWADQTSGGPTPQAAAPQPAPRNVAPTQTQAAQPTQASNPAPAPSQNNSAPAPNAETAPKKPSTKDLIGLASERGVDLKDQRKARIALRKLVQSLENAEESTWEGLITEAILKEMSIFTYAQAVSVRVAMQEAGAKPETITSVIRQMQASPLVPADMPYEPDEAASLAALASSIDLTAQAEQAAAQMETSADTEQPQPQTEAAPSAEPENTQPDTPVASDKDEADSKSVADDGGEE